MGKLSSLLYGAVIGAGLMYFLDPQMGERRKAMVRDQANSLRDNADEAVQTSIRDLRNRVRGLLAEGMAMVSEDGASDTLIAERVRSRLGFLSRHPGAIKVSVQNNTAILSGDVLANEVDNLMAGVMKIRGVTNVENRMQVHQDAGNIPQLQGQGWLPGDQNAGQWSPSTRLVAGVGAGYLFLSGMLRGGFMGTLSQLSGLVLGARAATNLDVRTMAGLSQNQGAFHVRKSIHIDAPVEKVYNLWSNFENFPKFMSHIDKINDIGNGKSHWVVKRTGGFEGGIRRDDHRRETQ